MRAKKTKRPLSAAASNSSNPSSGESSSRMNASGANESSSVRAARARSLLPCTPRYSTSRKVHEGPPWTPVSHQALSSPRKASRSRGNWPRKRMRFGNGGCILTRTLTRTPSRAKPSATWRMLVAPPCSGENARVNDHRYALHGLAPPPEPFVRRWEMRAMIPTRPVPSASVDVPSPARYTLKRLSGPKGAASLPRRPVGALQAVTGRPSTGGAEAAGGVNGSRERTAKEVGCRPDLISGKRPPFSRMRRHGMRGRLQAESVPGRGRAGHHPHEVPTGRDRRGPRGCEARRDAAPVSS